MEPPQGKSTTRDYEVFLSFRGPDTRLTVTDTLYEAMFRAGIRVFKDDEELRVGEEIGGELLRAISNSKIYVPIFSKDYASSKWCLRELAYMVACRKRGEKAILPIFYDVDASDVKLKTGSYGKALQKHERESGEDAAKQWEEALREVAGIKGWNLKDHRQDKLTALVVEDVLRKLGWPMQRDWRDDLVGVEDQMEAVMELLSQGTPDVRFVVIHGMGGIGKTTLAKTIFRLISSQFQCSSFLSDVRAYNIVSLLKKLLCDLSNVRRLDIMDADVAVDPIKRVISDKKVILVLDDMDNRDQLMKLAGESSRFGPGSRIIITTRNTYALAPEINTVDDNIGPMHHGDFFFYEMKEMQFHHALQLFSKHSFKRDSPPQDYSIISSDIVRMTGRLPLALEVIGSLLHLKSMETWKDTLKKLKEVPNKTVKEKLLISYNELDYEQQQIFLDIACHCIGEERIHAYYLWKACKFFPTTGLNVLIHLSLIKVVKDDRLWMHDQLRNLGRNIIRQESFQFPGERSRLWRPTDALNMVQKNLGTYKIETLKLTGLADGHNFTSDEFSRLPSLRFLELDGGNFVGDFTNLLSNLKWLSWRRCPSNLQATGLCLRELAVLKISESNITEDWNGWESCMVNDNLKVIYLTRCGHLKRTPDFSKCLNLKKLVFKHCQELERINSSIDQLGRLKYLEISRYHCWVMRGGGSPVVYFRVPRLVDAIGGLQSLSVLKVENQRAFRELPHSIGALLRLEHLSVRGCRLLHKISDSIGELRLLLSLDLSDTAVAELPDSIGNLKRLKSMRLDSTRISGLPTSIWTLENLEELFAGDCRYLEGKIPSEIAGLSQLKILNLSGSKVSGLPMTINQLSSLQELILSDCCGLETLPDLPTSLTKLELSSSKLQAVPDLSNLTNLRHLDISDCAFDCQLHKRTKGCIPNPNLEWLGRLHKLQTLRLVFSQCNFPPTDLSSLSQLRSLEITCPDPRSLIWLPSSLEVLSLEDVNTPIEWPMFPNLRNLSELKFSGCRLREIEFGNVPRQLENLQRLQVHKCESLVRLSNLSSLRELRVLSVEDCPQLIEIESQPSSSSTGDSSSSETPTPGTLKLEKLHTLRVRHCELVRKLPDIPSARHADVIGCPRLHGFRDPSRLTASPEIENFVPEDRSTLSSAHVPISFWSCFKGKIESRKTETSESAKASENRQERKPRGRGWGFCCMHASGASTS